MNVKRLLIPFLFALMTVGAVSAPAQAREANTSYKDNCHVFVGNVSKPTAGTRRVTVSVRCPYNQTVKYAYVNLMQDVSGASDRVIGGTGYPWSAGTRLTGNTTYSTTFTWTTSASNTYARFTFQNTSWTFPVVVESYANA